jgi:hypothetical protein
MDKRGLDRRGSGSRSAGARRRAAAHALSPAEARSLLAARLRERLPELRGAIATRAYAISDPHDVPDPAYPQSLHTALEATVEYALCAIEQNERRPPEVPEALLAQARLEARDRVPLSTVTRRYVAGNALFGDVLIEEAERVEIPSATLRRLLGAQATLFDRLLAAVGTEYARESENQPTGAIERRRDCVKRLLAGELVDHSELGYDLDAQHIALMAKGEGAQDLMRRLAARLDLRLLVVPREESQIWACWLGGRRRLDADEALRVLADLAPGQAVVTVGEPGKGLAGWRFSHLQAKAALPIAERRDQAVLRYADVALLASILRDDLVSGFLRQVYLAPLERSRDGGEAARKTLRAYFVAERNISSTAAALGVDRHTVRNRLNAIEGLIGRSLRTSAAELEIALRLDR